MVKNQYDQTSSVSESDKCDLNTTMLKIKLIDEKDSFKTLSPFKIHKSLDLLSNTWDWVNYTNNYKTLTIKETSQSKINDFLKIDKLEINGTSYNVGICKSLTSNHTKGVIYSKGLLSISDEEILNSLISQNVCEIYRFRKTLPSGISFETGSFALTFLLKKRPEQIKISFLNLQVYPMLQKPMQCTHCMLIGHTLKCCKSLHEKYCSDCYHRIVEGLEHQCINVCKNCRGSHSSDLKTCPAYVKEIKILQLKTKEEISYFDAKKAFNEKSNNSFTNSDQINKLGQIQLEKSQYESDFQELKLVVQQQNDIIEMLSEENENLKKQSALLNKKIEINKKLTEEILTQLKKSNELNSNFSTINQKLQQQNENLNTSLQEFSKKLDTSKFYGSCMKKFIDCHEKTATEFKKYMDLIVNEDGTSDDEY